MKKILIIAAVFLFVVLLTNMANNAKVDEPYGYSFSLKAQKVVACNASEITLSDAHNNSTRLDKDDSWPDCSTFKPDQYDDYDLTRGAKTIYKKREKTAWWRKSR